jgi:hypothetical protein
MRERVNVIMGKKPIILIAPHCQDDHNTALITKITAATIEAYAVINQGFERGKDVDVENDIADCNRVDHCQSEIVYDEFLKPLLKIRNIINKRSQKILILHIHGAGDIVHKEANEQIDVIVGYGLGIIKPSLTCETWRKNLFIDTWRNHSDDGEVYEGKGSGRYAGRSSNNMNQYFRKHLFDKHINSMQLEFPFSMRKTEILASITAVKLSRVLKEMTKQSNDSYEHDVLSKFI